MSYLDRAIKDGYASVIKTSFLPPVFSERAQDAKP